MKRALIGAGGHAREVEFQMNTCLTKFIEDEYFSDEPYTRPLSEFDSEEYELMFAFSDSESRERISNYLPKETKYFNFIHPSAIISTSVEMGEGNFIGIYSCITTNIEMGDHCILNRYCQIGHDTKIGNNLSMMPGSIISGNNTIGDNLYMGSNSTTREKISICDNVIIGSNGCVVKNINDSGTYVGVPVKKIR